MQRNIRYIGRQKLVVACHGIMLPNEAANKWPQWDPHLQALHSSIHPIFPISPMKGLHGRGKAPPLQAHPPHYISLIATQQRCGNRMPNESCDLRAIHYEPQVVFLTFGKFSLLLRTSKVLLPKVRGQAHNGPGPGCYDWGMQYKYNG